MSKKMILISVALLITSSCATNIHRGVVAMKVSETTAHVGLNNNEVSVGDHVELLSNQCSSVKGEERSCRKISKGHGKVTSVINANYVAVEFNQGVAFQEGDFIEKHSH